MEFPRKLLTRKKEGKSLIANLPSHKPHSVDMSPRQTRRNSKSPSRPRSGRESDWNAFAPLATQADTDFVMDEVESGEIAPTTASSDAIEPLRGSNWHRTGSWGPESTTRGAQGQGNANPATQSASGWGSFQPQQQQQQQQQRQARPLPPQTSAFSAATPAFRPRRQSPPPYTEIQENERPMEWVSNVFRTTFGSTTANELREGARGSRPTPPQHSLYHPVDESSRRPRTNWACSTITCCKHQHSLRPGQRDPNRISHDYRRLALRYTAKEHRGESPPEEG